MVYRESFSAEDFTALATRVWQRAFDAAAVAEALMRTTNIGAWDGTRLIGSFRVLTDCYLLPRCRNFRWTRITGRQGIDKHLMEVALERSPGGALFLGAQPQSVQFFEAIGCTPGPVGFVMRKSS